MPYKDPVKQKEYFDHYFSSHRKELNAKQLEYYKRNRDWINVRHSKYCVKRLKTDVRFRLAATLRSRVRQALKKQATVRAKKTIALIGCTVEELKIYIESKFREGMSWNNWGRGRDKWHIDHIRPCASFDLTDPEQQKECFHYNNLQPLWEPENLSKNDKY